MKLLTAAAAITTCLLMSGNVMAQNIQIKVDGKAYAGGLMVTMPRKTLLQSFRSNLSLRISDRRNGFRIYRNH